MAPYICQSILDNLRRSPDYDIPVYMELSVINPITRKNSKGKLITTYAIYIETNDTAFTMSRSMVRRRYSDFVVLRSILHEQHPSMTVPRLPGKTYFGKRFDQQFIQERCSGLQDFLKAVVETPIYLSNKSLHLFLQTSLSMDQVQNVVNGCDSSELPHNNSPSLLLYPVESNAPSSGDRVGILKRDNCSSLATCAEHECQVRTKHEHMRVGSGILVCPYSIIPGKEGPASIRHSAGSVPFWVPGGSPKTSATSMRPCSSDTCLEGTSNAAGSLNGSKKRVSFLIEKEDRNSLRRRVEAAHRNNNRNRLLQQRHQQRRQQRQEQPNNQASSSVSPSSQDIAVVHVEINDRVDTDSPVEEDTRPSSANESDGTPDSDSASSSGSSSSSCALSGFDGCDDIEVISGIEITTKMAGLTTGETVVAEEVIGC